MSQQEIAEKAGISQQMVSSITAKVGITSLNSHFAGIYRGTRYEKKKTEPDLVKARYKNSTLWAKNSFKS